MSIFYDPRVYPALVALGTKLDAINATETKQAECLCSLATTMTSIDATLKKIADAIEALKPDQVTGVAVQVGEPTVH